MVRPVDVEQGRVRDLVDPAQSVLSLRPAVAAGSEDAGIHQGASGARRVAAMSPNWPATLLLPVRARRNCIGERTNHLPSLLDGAFAIGDQRGHEG